MSYQILIQPTAFQEIETSYRWMCDNLSADVANNWYYELQDAIASLQTFPKRCPIAPEASIVGREIRQLLIGKRKKYRVLFVVEKEVIAIIHVRHSHQPYVGESFE
jgi:plasmid stabilization system protein ParE